MSSDNDKVIVHGIPGEGARVIGVLKGFIPLLLSIFLFGIFSGLILPIKVGGAVLIGFVIVLMLMLWLAYNSYNGAESYFKGARGEEIVAVWLSALPEGYHVFHDVDVRGSDALDHLVVGPSGVFVIETKFWSGRVTRDGSSLLVDGIQPSRSPCAQVLTEVKAFKAFLSMNMSDMPSVVPVVCFAGNTFEADGESSYVMQGGVAVCNVNELCDLITKGGVTLSTVGIEKFIKLMEP